MCVHMFLILFHNFTKPTFVSHRTIFILSFMYKFLVHMCLFVTLTIKELSFPKMTLARNEKTIFNSTAVKNYMLVSSTVECLDSLLEVLFIHGIINTPILREIDAQETTNAKMVKLLEFLEARLDSLNELIQAFQSSEDTRRIGEELDEQFSNECAHRGLVLPMKSYAGSTLAVGSSTMTSTVGSGKFSLWRRSSRAQEVSNRENHQSDTLTVGNYNFKPSKDYRLGEGAFGKVYKGRSKENEFEEVAVKIVDFADNDDNRKLFALIENLVGKQHANIVRYLQVTTENENMYIVTEFCQTDLEKMIKGGRRNLEYLHSIARQLAEGYHALYYDYTINFDGRLRRIIHRDIKPANLFITNLGPNFILKIGDFGCSELVRQENSYHYGRSGDPKYWAPEIRNPSHRPRGNHKLDIWSMGIVILEAALGKHPIDRIEDVREGYEVPIPENFVIPIHQETCTERLHCERLREMLQKMLKYDYHARASIDEFCQHPFHQYPFIRNKSESE